MALGSGVIWSIVAGGQSAPTNAVETTKRALDANTQAQFVKLLVDRFPEKGSARVHYIDIQFKPFTETIVSLFESAGWAADSRMRQTSEVPLVRVQGVGIAAFKKNYMDGIKVIFEQSGVVDTYTELRELKVPKNNPKFPKVVNNVYIYVGFRVE